MHIEMLRDLVIRAGQNRPHKTAYICGEKSITWKKLDERSSRAASAFQQLGLKAGDAIGIMSPETIEVYEHFFTCFKTGAVRTGINRRFSAAEILHVIKDTGMTMLMVHADCMPLIKPIKDKLGVRLIGFGGDHGCELDYEQLLLSATSEPDFPPVDPDAPAMYTYTSGTTGNPKGVILSDRALKKVIQMAPGTFGFSPDDIFYCPLANTWAAVVTNLLCLSNGMTQVIPDKDYNTVALLKDIERLGITGFLLAPTMLQWFLDELDKQSYDISSVRLVMYGSSPATPKLIAEVIERLDCDMLQAYGASECAAGWVTNLSPADHRRGLADKPELLQSAGRVPTYFDISIRDDAGREVPKGEVGEVWVRSDCVMLGYLNLPDQTEEVLKEGGWLITNDMGVIDDEGYLYLKDRRKFMIVTGGINVFPAGVEAIMSGHPSVAEIAVIGVPHKTWGEAVVAVVCRHPGYETTTQQDLLSFCDGTLSKVMLPKYIHFTDEPLPRSANLKLQKHVIQQWFRDNPDHLPPGFID